MSKLFTVTLGLVCIILFRFQTVGQVTTIKNFTERHVWDGPYDIQMIASPSLEPAYVNPTAAASNVVQVDSLISCETIVHTGSLLDINNQYQDWPPNTVKIPMSTIFCPEGTEPCPQGYDISTSSSCPDGRYSDIIYEEKMVYLAYADYDNDLSTFSSSRASFTTTGCNVSIEAAYLYWFGQREQSDDEAIETHTPTASYNGSGDVARVNPLTYKTVKMKAPGSAAYTNITAQLTDTYDAGPHDLYVCVADVSNELKGTGGGDIWVANVQSYLGRSSGGSFAGWTLVVVYSSPMSAPRRISLWDGLINLDNEASETITLTGIQTPSTNNFKSFIGYACLDGENFAARVENAEYLEFQTNNGGAVVNINPNENRPYPAFSKKGQPANDNFSDLVDGCKIPQFDNQALVYDGVSSSHITTYDEYTNTNGNEIDRTPSCKNTIGIDVHHLLLPDNSISTGATEATLTFNSGEQGGTSPFLAYIAIETLQPKLEVTKTVDVHVAKLEETVSYSLWVKNTGGLASLGSTSDFIIDTLDRGINYVPGSCSIAGASLVAGSPGVLQIPLSTIAVGDSVEITFQAVLKDISYSNLWVNECKRDIVNVAWSQYKVPDGRIFKNISNATDCAFGSATVVKIVDESLGTQNKTVIGPIDIASLATANIIVEVQQALLSNGVNAADIGDFIIYYNDDYKRVHPDSLFNESKPGQYFLAIRTLGVVGQCEEIFELHFIASVEPTFTQDFVPVSCFGSGDGNIGAVADFGSTFGEIAYYLVPGTIATEAAFEAATILASQPLSTKKDFEVSNLNAGTYTLVAEDKNAKLYYLYYTLEQPGEIDILLSTNNVCAGETAAVSIQSITGRPDISVFSYSWEYKTLGTAWAALPETGSALTLQVNNTTQFRVTAHDGMCTALEEITVTVTPLPVFDLGADIAICEGESATLSGPPGMDAYNWSTGETAETISVSNAGGYQLTVTNDACTASDAIAVQTKTLPQTTISGANAICNGETSILTATGATSYLWNTGETTESIVVSPASTSTYSVNGISNGCESTVTETLVVKALPIVDLGNNIAFCETGTITAQTTASSFIWSTGASTKAIDVNKSGDYSVTVTENNCVASDEVHVEISTNFTVDLGAAKTMCAGETALFDAGKGDSYIWSTGAGTQQILATNAGVYSVSVTSGTCSGTGSVVLSVKEIVSPKVSIQASDNDVCVGTNVSFTIKDSQNQGIAPNYTWRIGNAAVAHNVTHIETDTLSNGAKISLEVENTDMCAIPARATAALTMHILPMVSPEFSLTAFPEKLCAKTQTTFSVKNLQFGGANPEYRWKINNTQIGASASYITSDTLSAFSTVQLTVISSEKCAQPLSQTKSVTVHPNPEPTITVQAALCKKDAPAAIEVTNRATTGGSYTLATTLQTIWEASGYNIVPRGSTTGQHTITATWTDDNACVGTASTTVSILDIAPPQVKKEYSDIIAYQPYAEFEALGTGTIHWYNNNFTHMNSGDTYSPSENCLSDECVFTYYVNQELEPYGCLSDSVKITYTMTSCPVPAPGVSPYSICDYDAVPELVVDTASIWPQEAPDGVSSIFWYRNSQDNSADYFSSGLSYLPPQQTKGVYTYWVRQYSAGFNCYGPSASVVLEIKHTNPPHIINPLLTVCDGVTPYPSFEVMAPDNASVTWYNTPIAGGTPISTLKSLAPAPTISVDTNFYVSQTIDGCESETVSVELIVQKKPSVPTLPPTGADCEDETHMIFAQVPFGNDIVWFNEDGLPLGDDSDFVIDESWLNADSEVTFKAIALSEDGCISDTSHTNYELISRPRTPNLIGNDVVCIGNDFEAFRVLTGEMVDSVSWYNGVDNRIWEGLEFKPKYFIAEDLYTLKVYAYHKDCESSAGIKEVNVVRSPEPKIMGDTSYCMHSLQQMFTLAHGSDENRYQWNVSGNRVYYELAGGNNAMFVDMLESGIDTIKLVETNTYGCRGADSIIFYVSPFPQAYFSTIENTGNQESVISNESIEAVIVDGDTEVVIENDYMWNFGTDTDTVFDNAEVLYQSYPYGYYTIWLKAVNSFGCADSISHEIFMDQFYSLYVPNAFAPNNMSPAVREFMPKGMGLRTYKIWIYDKWGNTVWYSDKLTDEGSPAEAWDGRYEGGLKEGGAYIWKIEAQFIDGSHWKGVKQGNGTFKNRGSVVLIR